MPASMGESNIRNQMSKYIPTKEDLTNQQLGAILAVVRELQPYLLDEIVEPGETPTASSLKGEAVVAATTTLIKALSRIDTILEDQSRYSIKPYFDAMAEVVKTHKAQQRFIAAQTASTEMLQRPSFALRPTVAIMGESYIAFWGTIEKAGEAICGVGNTPNEALADFDDAFDRAPKEQVIVIAEKAGIDLNLPKDKPE